MDPEQTEVLKEIAEQWPQLKNLTDKLWSDENINEACIGNLAFVFDCNATGWITRMEFSASSQAPFLGTMAPSLRKMAALQTIKLVGVLDGEPDEGLGDLKELWSLTFENCKFNATFPSSWSGMTSLRQLQYTNGKTEIAIPFPAVVGSMTALKSIVFNGLNLTGSIPASIGNLPLIEQLTFQDIPLLTEAIPTSITQSATLVRITLANLPSMSGSIQADWSQAVSLVRMTFSNVPLTGSVPSKPPPNLTTFQSTSTPISGAIPQTFIDSPELTLVSIDKSEISGTIPAPTDPNASKLNFYLVRSSKASHLHPDVLTAKNLDRINFSRNKIIGKLPTKIGPDQNTAQSPLTQLYLSDNALEGQIPSSYFVNAPNLTIFDSSNNKLEGQLPLSLADKTNWISIDVSSNSLSGAIPDSEKWSQNDLLTTILMKNNRLTGSIPQGLFQRSPSAKFVFFDFSGNRLDICALPENYTVPDNFATSTCKVTGQTPSECKCIDAWPLKCTNNLPIPETCPLPPSNHAPSSSFSVYFVFSLAFFALIMV